MARNRENVKRMMCLINFYEEILVKNLNFIVSI